MSACKSCGMVRTCQCGDWYAEYQRRAQAKRDLVFLQRDLPLLLLVVLGTIAALIVARYLGYDT